MRIYRSRDYGEMSRKAANLISAHVIAKPDCVLGLATGSTPLGIYRQLVEWNDKGDLSFAEVKTVNLDEYFGLSSDSEQSYSRFMRKNLFDLIDMPLGSAHIPNGCAENPKAECSRYDSLIQSLGGIDVQLLGLGHNGHIGFNEPESEFKRDTHLVTLTLSTVQVNKKYFSNEEEMPKQAFTMGIGNIMSANHIVVAVSGANKADVVKKAFLGPITPQVPASILQFHNSVTLVGDEAALSKI